MSTLLQWLGSDSWARVVQALVHTLWIGALLALVVFVVLRRTPNPFVRYRWCMAAMAGVLFGGLVAWAWLGTDAAAKDGPRPTARSSGAVERALLPQTAAVASPAGARQGLGLSFSTVPLPAGAPSSGSAHWAAWLALGWVLGASLMLARAAASVVRAGRLRRSVRPLEDEAVLKLVRAARRRLEVTRRFRVAVTDKLSSPAVLGVLAPTLVLPLSLLTMVPASQLQMILLHELAHIRRGDYLANLFQLLAESLLFFNPAVWWLSRQARLEREACCDALAAGLAEDRAEYARALARVAEAVLAARGSFAAPPPAPAFADQRRPSALKDRLQRLLVPGYRSGAGLTWRAFVGWLALGGCILLVSALGARWTLRTAAHLLTPQQRIERIETALKKLGQPPAVPWAGEGEKIPVSITVRTPDGSPLPDRTSGVFVSRAGNGSLFTGASPTRAGLFLANVPRGTLSFYARAEDFAPLFFGPIATRSTNGVENVVLTLDPGFPVRIKAVDADSGAPLAEAELECLFWSPSGGFPMGPPQTLDTDAAGAITLEHSGPLLLSVTVFKEGYETLEKRFDSPTSNAVLTVSTRRALPLAGLITDQLTGKPVAEAGLFILRAEPPIGLGVSDPRHPGQPLAQTDAQGRFLCRRLPRASQFWLMVRADGYADAILAEARPGQTNLQAALGPELRVKGRIVGDLSQLPRGPRGPQIRFENSYRTGDSSYGSGGAATVQVDGGEATFEFVSPVAGPLRLSVGDRTFTREVTAPVDDWVIDLSPEKAPPARKVTLRFVHPSGVPPKGAVEVNLPGREPHTAISKDIEIQNGEVSFDVPVGREFGFMPARTIGYWFEQQMNVSVTNGPGPLVLSVPVIPAGAIYAQARKADGTVSSDVGFLVAELKRAPSAKGATWPTVQNSDSWSTGAEPRKFVASPLPLGGTYRILARQTNNIAASEPIALTEAAPDRNVELQFRPGVAITGQVLASAGKPLPQVSVGLSWSDEFTSLGWGAPCLTDDRGRFVFDECAPNLGSYLITVRSPGHRSVSQTVNFRELPLSLRLEPGLRLTGRVLELKSGRPVQSAQVCASPETPFQGLSQLLPETTRTDDNGQFTFDTLGDASYRLYVDGCYYEPGSGDKLFKPGAAQPILLKMVIVQGAAVRLGEGAERD